MYSNDDDSVSTMSSTVASPYKPPYYSQNNTNSTLKNKINLLKLKNSALSSELAKTKSKTMSMVNSIKADAEAKINKWASIAIARDKEIDELKQRIIS